MRFIYRVIIYDIEYLQLVNYGYSSGYKLAVFIIFTEQIIFSVHFSIIEYIHIKRQIKGLNTILQR